MGDKRGTDDSEEINEENELNFTENQLISYIKKYPFIYDCNEKIGISIERRELIKETYEYIANKLTELMHGTYVFVGKYQINIDNYLQLYKMTNIFRFIC